MIMKDCWCSGKCPLCSTGDVRNHLCSHCGVEYCPQCHGTTNDNSGILDSCDCLDALDAMNPIWDIEDEEEDDGDEGLN